MKTIAIIPARSGSKGIINKNIREINGKPLLAYSIEAAKKSEIFDTIMVSTDSIEYSEIALKYGAEVPFLRSQKNSSDEASTRDCILEIFEEYKKREIRFDRFMILQPTSPLRTATNIIEAEKLYNEKKAKTVISVCEVDHSPLWCNNLNDNLSLNNFIKTDDNQNRQVLRKFYRINGAIYLHDVKYYVENEYCFDKTSFAYIMKKEESVDIDDDIDFLLASILIKQ